MKIVFEHFHWVFFLLSFVLQWNTHLFSGFDSGYNNYLYLSIPLYTLYIMDDKCCSEFGADTLENFVGGNYLQAIRIFHFSFNIQIEGNQRKKIIFHHHIFCLSLIWCVMYLWMWPQKLSYIILKTKW